jgi:hypothetical protein
MAYIQKPGRGNSPKTGNGLPSAFKQMSREGEEKPEVVTKASEKIHKELNANPVGKGKDFQTTYDPEAGFKGKETNIKNVIAGDYMHRTQGGKTIASVKKDSREAKNFIKETEKQIADQGFRRDKMAGYLNERKATAVVNRR